jgi:choice-of-anchor B domain-containing protein
VRSWLVSWALVLMAVIPRAEGASIQARVGEGAVDNGPGQALTATPCVAGFAGPYPCNNVDLMAFMPIASIGGGSGSDLWGWTDPVTGHEWALMGRTNGTAFVDVTDPANPVYVANLLTHTATSSWREIKSYGNYAYIVSDNNGAHGLQIFDLTRLRSITTPPVTFTAAQADGHYSGFGRCHDVAVDEQSGFLYCVGTDTFSGGLHILDLSNPVNPTFAGSFAANSYIHDTQCVVYHGPDTEHAGKQLCFAANSTSSGGSGVDRLAIIDVTNKSAPTVISASTYAGSGFIHQGWLTEDQRYFLVDDELDETNLGHNTYTYIWDVGNLDAPVLIGTHVGPTTAIDHNQFIKGHYSYQANYTAGLRILDLSTVASGTLTEVAFFDIVPATNAASFNGSWGNYPFFASGNVIVSGISGTQTAGLFVLKPHLAPDFALTAAPSTLGVCGTGDAATSVSVAASNGYAGPVTLSAVGLPAFAEAVFTPATVTVPGGTVLTVNVVGGSAGTYPFFIQATDGTLTRSTSAVLSVATSSPAAPSLNAPANGASNQPLRPSFTWSAAAGAVSYDLQIASQPSFLPLDIVQSATGIATTTYTAATDLDANTTYYWRVRTISACGTGPYSTPRSFTTQAPAAQCPLGTSALSVWGESFESGAPGWTHSGTADTWAASSVRTHDGALSFHAPDAASASDQRLASPAVTLPTGQMPVTLQFWNWQEIESEVPAALPAALHVGCRDGAILELSNDGGASWMRLETQLLTDPYDGLVSTGTGNPLGGLGAWCGNPQDWLNSVVDVSAWAGQSVRFRFRLGTDTAGAREGWYVDELRVQSCVPNPTPSLSIDDVTTEEADAHDFAASPHHSPLLTLAVTLSAPSNQTVTVNWATADGTATAGLDYVAGSGTLTFAPGATVQPVDVTMLPDTIPELPETFFVNLTAPVSATLADAQGVATILDNDTTPSLVLAGATIEEGDQGTRQLVFTVTQSQAIAETTTVGFFTTSGTAVSPSDFTAASGALSFPGGTTTQTLAIAVNGDPTDESDETFSVDLVAPAGATIASGHALGTIVDDDGPPGQELIHGAVESRSLAALPGGVVNPTLFRLWQGANASYEVVLDGISGGAAPVVLERLTNAQSSVLQTGVQSLTGGSAFLRWENRGPDVGDQWIRVRSTGCTSDCGADATYRVRAYETTESLAHFASSGTQATVLMLQNRGAALVSGHVDFWGATGAPLGTHAFSLPPQGSLTLDVATVSGIAGQSGSATVSHDGAYDDLVGKLVALEPSTGFSFDTPLVPRRR